MAQRNESALPDYADTVVVGGGSAGAVVAGRLAGRSNGTVLLLEAGPDYGPYDAGGWPPELLDGRKMPLTSHSWGYTSAAQHGEAGAPLPRTRVLGGCSSHNGCFVVWGQRRDYDDWERLGNPGWGTEALLPLFQAANRQMRVSTPTRDQISPFLRATLDAAEQMGLPIVADLNDVDLQTGAVLCPINIVDGVRWNAAFGYLDPVRARANLAIRGQVLADRLVIEGERVTGVEVVGPGGRARVRAGRVVLCGGAYGSPSVLLRSGIGAAGALRPLGVEVRHELPGVGQNLQDHPMSELLFSGTAALGDQIEAFVAAGGLYREDGVVIRARSSFCQEGADMQVYPMCTREPGTWAESHYQVPPGVWQFGMWAVAMAPRSVGSIQLASVDPEAPPRIDPGFLTDPEGRDLETLVDGVELMRTLAAQPALAPLLGAELGPGARSRDRESLRAYWREHSLHDYHPVGTCKMGPQSDPMAVVDARGKVYGVDNLYEADASIMPFVPRANTNFPTLVIAEKIAALLVGEETRPG